MKNVRVRLVRRSVGIEVEVEADEVGLSEIGEDNQDAEDLASTFLDIIEAIDGISGYKEKREPTDEEKARRKHYSMLDRRRKKGTPGAT